MSRSRDDVGPTTEPEGTGTAAAAATIEGTGAETARSQSQSLRRTNNPRFRPRVNSTTTDAKGTEVYTTTEIVRTRNGGTRVRIVKHDARTGDRLTPFLPSSDSESDEDPNTETFTKLSTDFDHTTAATVATSSPATVVRVREGSDSDGDTVRAVTDKLEPPSTAVIEIRSTDQTEEAQMDSRQGGGDDEVSDSAQEVDDDEVDDDDGEGGAGEHEDEEGEGEEEEQEEEGEEDEEEEEEEEGHHRIRAVENGLAVANKVINGHLNRNTRHQRHYQMEESEADENDEEAEYDDDEEEHGAGEDNESVATGYSEDQERSDSEDDVDDAVRDEMDTFCLHFKGIDRRFRLISKIGEGTFSSVYKAEDLLYDRYDNDWDLDASDDCGDRSPPPSKRRKFVETQRRRPKYVAIKKIYVTSSPQRIMNELELLHELRGCRDVVPLITAFRHLDQVVAILPYFKHVDFRNYFRAMTIDDMRLYFKSLFNALSHVHKCKIIHRDIKPTNFLYDYSRGRGVLVDFGLAEKEGTDWSHCPCQHSSLTSSQASAKPPTLSAGYIKNDNRPSRRANRAGTRGFRAPEVLFKCTSQTTKIDIWSAGVVLLTMLSKRFPFFNSADDVDATIEIATIFGKARMRTCALLHGAVFETTIPTIGEKGFTLEKIIMWATNRIAGGGGKEKEKDELREANMARNEKVACEFLARCLELDPMKRIDADEALEHEFLRGV